MIQHVNSIPNGDILDSSMNQTHTKTIIEGSNYNFLIF